MAKLYPSRRVERGAEASQEAHARAGEFYPAPIFWK
jgi:hypothetical protein